MIAENIIINKFDENRWVVNTPSGRNILVNRASIDLIEILQSNSSIESASIVFNEKFHCNLNEHDFKNFVAQKLSKYDLLTWTNAEHEKFQYLKLKFQFLPARVVKILSQPLTFLFVPTTFWITFLLLIVFISIVFSANMSLISLSSNNYYLIAMIVFVSTLLHELGHTASCIKNGVKHGGIGFGFYFIFPVFYADISNVWLIGKNRRVVTNLAGIYIEFLISGILCILFLANRNDEYLLAAILIVLKALTELNPFLRMDGYWILSDLTNTPNLLPKSNKVLKEFVYQIFMVRNLKNKSLFNVKNVLLFFYGLSNTLTIILYSLFMINNYSNEIASFPFDLKQLISNLVTLKLRITDFNQSSLLVLAFYAMILRIVIKKLLILSTKRFKKVGLVVESKTP